MLKLKLFVSFALTSLFLTTGCSENSTGNDRNDLDKSLIGEWEIEQTEAGGIKGPATGITFIFNSDGTFERNIVGSTSQSGTWKTKDGTLYLNDKNTPEYTIDYTFKESQLVITEGATRSFYSKTGGTGESETNPLIGEWELYKIEDGDFTSTKGDPGWLKQTIIITSNRITILMDDSEEHFDYTYKNGEIVPEDGIEAPPIHIENSQLVLTYGETKGYYNKKGETGDNETALIGEWELFKIDLMGEIIIIEDDDPDWENLAMTITSNKVIWTYGNEKDSSNYTCVDGQLIIENEYITYSFESENVLILDSSFDEFSFKEYYRKL